MSDDFVSRFHFLAHTVPEKVIFSYLEGKTVTSITYKQLHQQAQQISSALQSISPKGDRILLMYPPGLEFIAAFLGCAYAQRIIVPVIPPANHDTANKLKLIVEDAKPVACLSTKMIHTKLNKLQMLNKLSRKRFLGSMVNKISGPLMSTYEPLIQTDLWSLKWLLTDSLPYQQQTEFNLPPTEINTPLFLQYTSGSTGNPKGVMVTHQSLLHNLQAIGHGLQITPKDILYSWLPQYHDMGLIGCILTPLYYEMHTYIDSPLHFLSNPGSWIKNISKYKCTISAAPNFAYELVAQKMSDEDKQGLNLERWRVAVNSAEPIRISTLEKFTASFEAYGFKREVFYPSYGLAEATLFVTTKSNTPLFHVINIDKAALQEGRLIVVDPSDANSHALISSGDLNMGILNHLIEIVDPQTMQAVNDDELGEIWISSLSVNPGYWQQEEISNSTFKSTLANGNTTFLRTGDLGFKKSGQLYVAGRLKDIIIIRGKNFYPQDIEFTVEQSNPLIRAGCINAFSIDESEHESLVVLAELKNTDQYFPIIQEIKNNILRVHGITPEHILLLPPKALKKTTSGKVRRREMKQQYLNDGFKSLYEWHLSESIPPIKLKEEQKKVDAVKKDELSLMVLSTVKSVIRDTNSVEILPHQSLSDLGLDSLLMAEYVSKLNQNLPEYINLTLEDLAELPNLEALIHYIRQLLKEPYQFTTIETQPVSQKLSESEQAFWMDIKNLNDFKQLEMSTSSQTQEINRLFFNEIEGISDNTIQIDGKSYINYAGYNYLGYSGDERVISATIKAVAQYGTSVSASRLVSGQKAIHSELESELASLIGTEDAIVFTAGHATNVSVLTHLFHNNDIIFHDALIHNSALQGAIFSKAKRVAFPHNDFLALEQLMAKERAYHQRAIVLIEGAYSMDGDIPNVPEFIRIKNKYHAHLMIDEAHSLGVIGKNGGGIREYFNLSANEVDLWMGTLSKAFASCGGYIAGSHELIDFLKKSCGGFVFSAGMSPANAAAALSSVRLLKQEPHRPQELQKRASELLAHLKKQGIDTGKSFDTPIIPLIIGDEMQTIHVSLELRKHGIYAMPIIYPAVDKGLARIRLFINCKHTREQILYTAEILCKYLGK